MKKGKVYKRGTAAFTPEEISSGKVEPPDLDKMREEMYKGKLTTSYDKDRGVSITTNKREDPYPNKKNLKTDARGKELNIILNADDRALKSYTED